MPDAQLVSMLKDLAPASAAVVGFVIIVYYIVQMMRVFIERHMKFMDRHIEILDKHSMVISGITAEMRVHGEIIATHTNIIKQVERSMESSNRLMQRFEDRRAI